MGEKGEPGIQGPKGENGESPVITVTEDTPISYKLNFKTSEQDITTPNLFAPYSEYRADISAGGARTSVRVQWSEYYVAYEVPETT